MRWLEPRVAIIDLNWPDQNRAEYCSAWERQLAREVGPQHILRGVAARPWSGMLFASSRAEVVIGNLVGKNIAWLAI